jgi:putative ABC transport system ATP-binding protein
VTARRVRADSTMDSGLSAPGPDDRSVFIRFDRVYKMYRVRDTGVAALSGVTMEIERGRFAAIVGPSGAGKSSILNLIGAIETATAGVVEVEGRDLAQLDQGEQTEYRRGTVGFLWQGATKNLVPYLTTAQNVMLPLLLGGRSAAASRQRVLDLLDFLGLADRARHLPQMLSGGEQQRLALAIALANSPAVVLADEPTAEVDRAGAERVVQALADARQEFGATVIMATHDLVAAAQADVVYRLVDGRLRAHGSRGQVDGAGRLTLPHEAARTVGTSEVEIAIEDGELRIRRLDTVEPPVESRVPTPTNEEPLGTLIWSRERAEGLPGTVVGSGEEHRPDLLRADDVSRIYVRSGGDTAALQGVSVRLRAGQLVVLMGPSGSGKSTLLGILAGLDRPDEGLVSWAGRPLDEISEEESAGLRATWLGMVFQALGLLPSLSAQENVVLPLLMAGVVPGDARELADDWLRRLGLGDRIGHRINELSVGQQQRVAVARALATAPTAVLADEPTAEVDAEAAAVILGTLHEVTRRGGGVLIATHDPRVLDRADWVVVLRDGRVEREGPPGEVRDALTTD